ncbi:hypothetical protein [Chitinophaga pinensis]|uniref:Uncharacterized protein n=1 Tax=Chitinophaga pinensis TaxID=79329 RepID=A0A5C6LJS8_9BACT|nr:hypothetical protein [Chitinophaga pinensis]TWV93634.1 hypothetical protein FEF09_26880 [Chitinophaga pinensis]
MFLLACQQYTANHHEGDATDSIPTLLRSGPAVSPEDFSFQLFHNGQLAISRNCGDPAVGNFTQYIEDSVLNKYVASRTDRTL